MTNKKAWMLVLASLALLIAGCSTAGAKPDQAEMAAPTAIPVAALTADDVRRITLTDAKALLDSGRAVLYDVRPAEQYQAQHAAGAMSFPESEAAARLRELPADRTLIFYCT